jgi:heme/copper-type cytochrome/quinol oxidase subunit 2
MGVRTRKARRALLCGASVLGLLITGCTSSAEPGTSSSPTAVSSPIAPSFPAESPSSPSPSPPSLNPDYPLTINITIKGGKTVPSGEKINMRVGQKVILNVTSDTDDEVHAHIGGPGYELEVKAGTPAKGEFTIDSPGSFEVESHHLEKIIVILNAR